MQFPTRAFALIPGLLSMIGLLSMAPSWAIAAKPSSAAKISKRTTAKPRVRTLTARSELEAPEGASDASSSADRGSPEEDKDGSRGDASSRGEGSREGAQSPVASGRGPSAGDEAAAPSAPSGATTAEISASSAADVRRGFFIKGDLGLFATLGGTWTNRADLPSRPISNVEPHLGVVLGYDLMHSPSYTFSLGARLAMAFNGGAGRVSQEEIQAGTAITKSSDYSILETGLEVGLALMLADRFALSFIADAGAGFVDPNPTLVATDPGAGGASFAPLFGFGVGGEYYTLLNDFSVGLQLRFLGVLAPRAGSGGSEFIPGLALTFPLKYTF